MLRPLVDHMHWEIPFWRQLIKNVGMVPGTRESCAALMEAGEHVLVFRRERREVCKQKGEAYQLIWRNRTGFAHMAVAHGYDIIPVATIGAEEMFDILVDAKDVMNSPLGAWIQNSGFADKYLHGGENLPPIVKGIGRSIIPKPQRHYIMVGERIDTTRFNGEAQDHEALVGVRQEVEHAFARMFEDLQALRKNDQDNGGARSSKTGNDLINRPETAFCKKNLPRSKGQSTFGCLGDVHPTSSKRLKNDAFQYPAPEPCMRCAQGKLHQPSAQFLIFHPPIQHYER